jgi:hypothetical protein
MLSYCHIWKPIQFSELPGAVWQFPECAPRALLYDGHRAIHDRPSLAGVSGVAYVGWSPCSPASLYSTDTSPHPEQLEPTQLRGGHETFIEIDVPSAGGLSARFLLENRKLIAQTDTQRHRGSLSLGGLTLLGGGDFSENAQLQPVLCRFRLERPRPGLYLSAGSPDADLLGCAGRQVGRCR